LFLNYIGTLNYFIVIVSVSDSTCSKIFTSASGDDKALR